MYLTKIKDTIIIVSGTIILIRVLFFLLMQLYTQDLYFKLFLLFLIATLIIYYACTMSSQTCFFGYFNSWEWRPFHSSNNLKDIAGDHAPLLKKSFVNFLIVVPLIGLSLWALIHFELLTLHTIQLNKIIWFNPDLLSRYLFQQVDMQVVPLSMYLMMGMSVLLLGMAIYTLIYPKYPCYRTHNTPFEGASIIKNRHLSLRDTFFMSLTFGMIGNYVLFNIPIYLDTNVSEYSQGSSFIVIVVALILILGTPFWSKVKWTFWISFSYFIGFIIYLYYWFSASQGFFQTVSQVIIPISKILISVSIVIMGIVVLVSMIFMLMIYFTRNKATTSPYIELTKMNPHWGFNWNFVSESFVNDEIISNQELYEQTSPRKKCFFWPEYFFANILNRNVKTLLADKKLLWLKAIFNLSNTLIWRNKDPHINSNAWSNNDSVSYNTTLETLPTSTTSKIEDPEGDVFFTLEQNKEITNTNPSIWSVFYVSGLIYWHIIPHWLAFNVVFFVLFTKLIEWIAPFNFITFNTLVYGYQGVIAFIFLGFLFMIFMNNMAIWLAWKKYYRLKAQGNNEALFFSIFKQRAILQSINQYVKDDQGNILTHNYSKGYYPAFNIEIMNSVLHDLSPKLYSLYDKKFPINWH